MRLFYSPTSNLHKVPFAAREKGIGTVAIECAAQDRRKRAGDWKVVRLALQEPGNHIANETFGVELTHRLIRSVALISLFRRLTIDDDLLGTAGRTLEVILAVAHPVVRIAPLGVVTLEVWHDVTSEQFV